MQFDEIAPMNIDGNSKSAALTTKILRIIHMSMIRAASAMRIMASCTEPNGSGWVGMQILAAVISIPNQLEDLAVLSPLIWSAF